jgi:hypothetical protein
LTTHRQNILGTLSGGVITLLRAVIVAVLPYQAVAENRFPDHQWGLDLLLLLEAGPALLDPGLDLGLRPPPDAEETRSELDRMQLISARLRDRQTRDLILREADADPRELLREEGLIPIQAFAPNLWDLLDQAIDEATYFALREKRRFARPRPSAVRAELGMTIPDPPHPAYPSGHSAQIHTLARVLAALRPGCEETYRLFAAGVAFRREIAGVHFPSDTRAGELLAASLAPRLSSHPELAASLRGARREMGDLLDAGACKITGGP